MTCPNPCYIPTFQSYSVSASLVLSLHHSLSQSITMSHSFTILSIVWQFYSLLPQSFYSFCIVWLFINLYTTVFTLLVTKSCFPHCAYVLYTRLELVSFPTCSQGRGGPTSLFLSVFIIWASPHYNAMGIFTALIHSYHLLLASHMQWMNQLNSSLGFVKCFTNDSNKCGLSLGL